jgi:hypothetical protein
VEDPARVRRRRRLTPEPPRLGGRGRLLPDLEAGGERRMLGQRHDAMDGRAQSCRGEPAAFICLCRNPRAEKGILAPLGATQGGPTADLRKSGFVAPPFRRRLTLTFALETTRDRPLPGLPRVDQGGPATYQLHPADNQLRRRSRVLAGPGGRARAQASPRGRGCIKSCRPFANTPPPKPLLGFCPDNLLFGGPRACVE